MSLLHNAEWKIPHILKVGEGHSICFAFMDVTELVAGSSIRRAGVKGRRAWAAQWDGVGFDCDENFMRVYVSEANVEVLKTLVNAHNEKYAQHDLTPDENIGYLDVKSLFEKMFVIDGMHRTVTLQEAQKVWSSGNPDTPHTESPYLRVRVQIYNPSVCFMMAVLAKASNDSKQVHVSEDGLERITLTQKVVESFRANVEEGAKVSETMIAKYPMEQAGCKKDTAVKYHAQLVGMAIALEGPVTEWLSATIDAYEEAETQQAEVTYMTQPRKLTWWCGGVVVWWCGVFQS